MLARPECLQFIPRYTQPRLTWLDDSDHITQRAVVAFGSAGQTGAGSPQDPLKAPRGGISQAQAIQMATIAIHPSAIEMANEWATPTYDQGRRRWVWDVYFATGPAGPTSGGGRVVSIDYLTGLVLDVGQWVS